MCSSADLLVRDRASRYALGSERLMGIVDDVSGIRDVGALVP